MICPVVQFGWIVTNSKEHFGNAMHKPAHIAKRRKFDYLVWVTLQNTTVIFFFTVFKYQMEGWFFIDLTNDFFGYL